MRTFSRTSQFQKDVKLAGRRGKDLEKLKTILELLIAGNALPGNTRITPCGGILPAAATTTLNRTGC